MLPDKNRLKRDKDFKDVFENGNFFSSEYIAVRVKRNNTKTSRFGFIVGNKVSKKSTKRNLIKRRLREIVRRRLKNVIPGLDVVIIVKPEILNKNFKEINENIDILFKKAKIIKNA